MCNTCFIFAFALFGVGDGEKKGVIVSLLMRPFVKHENVVKNFMNI